MKIIALQPDIAWEDKRSNFEQVRALLAAARPEPGALVILPEMFATGFSMNMQVCAESYGGETELFLAGLARELKCWCEPCGNRPVLHIQRQVDDRGSSWRGASGRG